MLPFVSYALSSGVSFALSSGIPYVVSNLPFTLAAWKVANQAYGLYDSYNQVNHYIEVATQIGKYFSIAMAGASATSWIMSKTGMYITQIAEGSMHPSKKMYEKVIENKKVEENIKIL